MDDRLSSEEKKELPDSVFGLPERREYPMPDAAHVRAAEAYFRYCPEELKPELPAPYCGAPASSVWMWSRRQCSDMPARSNMCFFEFCFFRIICKKIMEKRAS